MFFEQSSQLKAVLLVTVCSGLFLTSCKDKTSDPTSTSAASSSEAGTEPTPVPTTDISAFPARTFCAKYKVLAPSGAKMTDADKYSPRCSIVTERYNLTVEPAKGEDVNSTKAFYQKLKIFRGFLQQDQSGFIARVVEDEKGTIGFDVNRFTSVGKDVLECGTGAPHPKTEADAREEYAVCASITAK